MGLTFKKGNLFNSHCSVLVNACNKVGVMGGGIAKEFKKLFPSSFVYYKDLCDNLACNKYFDIRWNAGSKHIVFFYTKEHWRDPSILENIDDGLAWFRKFVDNEEIESFAFPALGCGLGGLNWEDVKALFIKHLSDIPQYIEVYEPLE